jgi:hypothetical protein
LTLGNNVITNPILSSSIRQLVYAPLIFRRKRRKNAHLLRRSLVRANGKDCGKPDCAVILAKVAKWGRHNMKLTKGYRIAGRGALLGAIAASATPAFPQAWIGLMVGDMIAQQQQAVMEHACMTGTAMIESEVAEARPTTLASMRGYWNIVKGGSPALVQPYFHVHKKSALISGPIKIAITPMARVTDPFAAPGAQLAADPVRLFRSGDGASVRFQWEVRDAAAKLIGTYDAALRRGGATWRLFELRLIPANEYVEPLVQYCHEVGDVMPYRLISTERTKTYTTQRAVKMAAKAEKAEAAAAKVLARTMNSSGHASPADKLMVREASDKAKSARNTATETQLAAETAAADNAKAKVDAKAMEDARAEAMAKLAAQ